MTVKAKIAIGLSLFAAAGLVLGALVLPWWTGQVSGGSFQIDLRHMKMCLHGVCGEPKALVSSDASATPWAKVGIATLAASLVAATLAIGVVIRLITGKKLGVLPWVAGVLAVFSGLLAIIFIWAHPSFGEWTPGFGMAATLAGSFAAALASVFARDTLRKK